MEDGEGMMSVPRGTRRPLRGMICQRWKLLIVIIALVLSFTLIVILAMAGSRNRSPPAQHVCLSNECTEAATQEVCLSEECNKAAQTFLMSMSMGRKSPCEDFYEFVCGSFNPSLSIFPPDSDEDEGFVESQPQDQMLTLTEAVNPAFIQAQQQLKIYHHSCQDLDSANRYEAYHASGLDSLFTREDSVGKTLAKIMLKLGLGLIYNVDVGVGLNKDGNLEKEIIIDQPKLANQDLLNETSSAFRAHSYRVNSILYRFQHIFLFLDLHLHLRMESKDDMIFEFLRQLVIMQTTDDATTSTSGNSNHMSLLELNALFHNETRSLVHRRKHLGFEIKEEVGQMDWIEYMETIFEGVPAVNISPDLVVNVRDVEYVKRVGNLLATLPISQIRLGLFTEMLLKLGTDLRVLSYFDLELRRTVPICAVKAEMPFESVYELLAENDRRGTTFEEVEEMLDYFGIAFNSTISSLYWMDPVTNSTAMSEEAGVRAKVGHPHWILNPIKRANESYDGFNFTNGKGISFIRNELTIRKWRMEKNLKEFSLPVIPEGYLQFPYFGSGISAIEYGALSSNLGREFAHGLDAAGRKGGESGKRKSWWKLAHDEETSNVRNQCISDQFEGYWENSKGKEKEEHTLQQVIADNRGLRVAFEAFKMSRNSSGREEKTLPGFESYSSEQLFFISYAHSHCSHSGFVPVPRGGAPHNPNWIRVMATLFNYEEFSRVWQCPRGSRMNPEKKCGLWGSN